MWQLLPTQARLKLYEYQRELGKSVLYCDTDSVIYIQKIDEAPKLKKGIIWATDELEEFGSGSFTEEFVSGGRRTKHSVFCLATEKRTYKCKGYNLELQFTSYKLYFLRKLILEDNTPLHVHNPKKIKRKHGGGVEFEPESKEYKVLFKKCRLMNDFNSFHYAQM
jgi:hypothetical protein